MINRMLPFIGDWKGDPLEPTKPNRSRLRGVFVSPHRVPGTARHVIYVVTSKGERIIEATMPDEETEINCVTEFQDLLDRIDPIGPREL